MHDPAPSYQNRLYKCAMWLFILRLTNFQCGKGEFEDINLPIIRLIIGKYFLTGCNAVSV